MKKNTIILTTLIATATVSGASLANIDTYTNYADASGETDFKVEIKDVTENYNKINDFRLEHPEEYIMSPETKNTFETFKYTNLKIMVPNAKTIDLNNSKFSSNIDPTLDDNYAAAFKTEINQSILNDGIEVGEEEMFFGMIYEEPPVELEELPDYWFNWYSDDEDYVTWSAKKDNNESIDKEWMYDTSPLGDYLMTDLSLNGNDYEVLGWKMDHYISLTAPLIIEGELNYMDVNELGIKGETHNITWEIKEDSINKVSLYAQRDTGYFYLGNSIYDDKYLLASDTFTQKEIDDATPISPRLSNGAIAGIVIGSIAGVALLGGGSYWLIKNKG